MTDYQKPYRCNNQNSGTGRCECGTSGWYVRPLHTKALQSTTQNANISLLPGPIINAALPALGGILSSDSTQAPDFSKPSPPEGQPPFKLDDVLKPITTEFQATKSLIKGVQESVNNLSSELQTGFASIDSHIESAIAAAEKRTEIRDAHKKNIDLVNRITAAQ